MHAITPEIAHPRGRFEAAAAALVGRRSFWVVLVLAIASWPAIWALRTPLPPPLPVLAAVPGFELTDQQGHRFGSEELAGRVWLASFIFTRCQTVCPAITSTMARIQGRTRNLAPAFRLVSFSVDPGFDTPGRLEAYARAHRASPRMWSFLTGPVEAVRSAVEQGLKVSMDPGGGDAAEISHGTHLVLVDGRGRVRRYYDPGAPDVVDRVVRDVALVVNRGG